MLLLLPISLVGVGYVFLAFIAGVAIGFSFLLNILPALIACYIVFSLAALLISPFKPCIEKHKKVLNTVGAWLLLIFVFPPITVILGGIIALPFVLIYAIADNPFLWYGLIFSVITVFSIYLYLNRDAIHAEIKRKEDEKIWQATRERAALHKYLYHEHQ